MSPMKRLLFVFAHPDDESFSCGGTIAKYVAAGWHVDLMCATRGEEGNRGPFVDLPQNQLGEIRQKELQKAGMVLGISSITFLGWFAFDANIRRTGRCRVQENGRICPRYGYHNGSNWYQ